MDTLRHAIGAIGVFREGRRAADHAGAVLEVADYAAEERCDPSARFDRFSRHDPCVSLRTQSKKARRRCPTAVEKPEILSMQALVFLATFAGSVVLGIGLTAAALNLALGAIETRER